LKQTVFANEHETTPVKFKDWYGHITIQKGEKQETEVYELVQSTRIEAKNQFQQVAKRLKGQLTYLNAY
jgi:hypothetical protein